MAPVVQVSQSHVDPDYIKTDAPPKVVWDVLRCAWLHAGVCPPQRSRGGWRTASGLCLCECAPAREGAVSSWPAGCGRRGAGL